MRFLILICAMLLASCVEQVNPQPQPGDIHQLPPIEWRVVDRAELERVYRNSGMPLESGQSLQGFVGRANGKTIIYTLPPRSVDDQTTVTLGHEVLHVALGSYHE